MKLTSRLVIISLVSLLLVLYAATVYLAISTDYRLTLTGAKRQVAALSLVLEQHASRTMGEAESVLDTTSRYLVEQSLFAPGAGIADAIRHSDALLARSPQIKAVFLVDAAGVVIANSERNPFIPFYAGDREYFRYHAEHIDLTSHISAPVKSRLDGSPLFTITRRVNRPDGTLAMVTGLAIDPGYFSRFYQRLDLGGARGEVYLARNDGTILARRPRGGQDATRSLENFALFRSYLQTRHGNLEGEEFGPLKLSAFRESEIYPLLSFISLDRDEVLAPWRTRALRHGEGALASVLLTFLVTLALVKKIKKLARANETLHAQKLELELAAQVFEQSQQSIVITDRSGTILRVNSYFTELTGFSPAEAIGRTPRVLKSQRHDGEFYQGLWRGLHQEGHWRGEIWNRKKNGDGFAALLSIASVRDAAGEIIYFIGVIEDITEQKLSSERIYRLAHFDVLTNLPNRRLFNDRLLLAVQQAERHGYRFTVMFLDLDNFKRINDTLGHHAGDLLLQAVAQRLLDCLRKVDAVARFGGDEFAIMLEEVQDPSDVQRIAGKLIAAVSAPVDLEGVEVQVGVSIGVSMYAFDAASVEQLFKNADTAMYQAKALGKNRCQFFAPEMTARVTHRLALETELRRAIPSQLFLRYQPQSTFSGGRLLGAEALVRWQHPERGELLPDEFLGVAEESGQLVRLENWVLETACRQAGFWQHEKGIPLRVAVNVSFLRLIDPFFPEAVARLLRDCRLDPALLELEFAGTAVVDGIEQSAPALGRLKDLGVSLALDKFVTGGASFLTLKTLPLDRLKIDGGVIGDIQESPENLGMVRRIIAMARSLNLQIIAVGVENEHQLEILKSEGCDGFQGYLLASPLAPAALEGLFIGARTEAPELSREHRNTLAGEGPPGAASD